MAVNIVARSWRSEESWFDFHAECKLQYILHVNYGRTLVLGLWQSVL